jgi:RNA polymerase sigma-70 factor, ECF subfamily
MGLEHDDTKEDAALARRIPNDRDSAAEGLLCTRLFPRIRAYGLRHLRNDAAASDLAQHVLVVVLEALRAGRVEDVERLPAFVMGICRNTVLDWRKVDRRRDALLERFGPSFVSVALPEPEVLDTGKLIECLEELAPRQRTIMTLTYYSERGADEIASELAMSPGNVRVARHRALGHLHECITRGEAS